MKLGAMPQDLHIPPLKARKVADHTAQQPPKPPVETNVINPEWSTLTPAFVLRSGSVFMQMCRKAP